ncbi:MAG: cellulose binding domain-containing protein [Anaeromyxobacter sp.]
MTLVLATMGACAVDPEPSQHDQAEQSLTTNGFSATLSLTSDWGGGYCADVKVANVGTTKITAWTVEIELGGATFSSMWGGTATVSGSKLTAIPASYNATLEPGASGSFGFCANGTARPSVTKVTPTGGTSGTGGTTSTGGSSSVGGSTSGTTTAKGGSVGTGGTTAKGGSVSTGGTPGSGGTTSAGGSGGTPQVSGHYQMENVDRGVVAVKLSSGVYVGWRMFGYEYDAANPANVAYNVYRDGAKIAQVTNSTNYTDAAGSSSSVYTVRAVIAGVEQAASPSANVWAQNYLRVPLQVPAGATTDRTASGQTDAAYTYTASDASPGDLNGDGKYDLVLKWDPTNSKDNSQSGFTGNVYLDGYTLSGTRLFRIDLGKNIRAGAHYTQFVVYDFDGDGKSEIAVKTAPGTKDGTGKYLSRGPAASDDDSADYRNASGYVLSGPEYLTVFSGQNGAELATGNFEVGRGTVSSWGDSYGNRVDRFLASAAFVSDAGGQTASGKPAILMARGYYTRATISAYTYRNGTLSKIWTADSNGSTAYAGQGAHSMVVADVDNDGAQEIIYGASTVDSNGTRKCSTGFGHGDALHVSDFVPSRAGLEVFMPHEDGTQPTWDFHDANTCTVLQKGAVTGADTGRGVAADISAANAGAEMWTNAEGLLSAGSGSNVGSKPGSANFLVFWDADELRELENGTSVTKYGGGTLVSCSECASNNGTKSTPTLTADLLGDWREEVVWRESNNAALRIYTTTAATTRRIYTLMHDPQYRMQVSSEQTAYNQPPHTGFFIGGGMSNPPKPDIYVK